MTTNPHYSIHSPKSPTFHQKGRKGYSNPDLIISTCINIEPTVHNGQWNDASDHLPMSVTWNTGALGSRNNRRISKALLESKKVRPNINETYKVTFPRMINKLNTCNRLNAEQIYREATKSIVEPWQKLAKRRPRNRPPFWNLTLQNTLDRKRKLYVKAKKSGLSTHKKESKLFDKIARQAWRTAKAKFEEATIKKIQQNPNSDMCQALQSDKRKAEKRKMEALRKGKQLTPADFTKFMALNQDECSEIFISPFQVKDDLATDITKVLNTIKKGKAVGTDGIHAEMLTTNIKLSTELLLSWWRAVGRTGIMPHSWKRGALIPLFKKGDQSLGKNYRPLCMLSHARKIIESAITIKVERHITTDKDQYGFQKDINILQAAIEVNATMRNTGTMVAVLDLEKAFDKVNRSILLETITELTTPELTNELKPFMAPLQIMTTGDTSKTTATLKKGVTQGGPSSPTLFKCYINDLPKRVRKAVETNNAAQPNSNPGNNSIKMVADDVIITANNTKQMDKMLDECTAWAKNKEMKWNASKCIIIINNPNDSLHNFKIGGDSIAIKQKASYLGLQISKCGFDKPDSQKIGAKTLKATISLCSAAWFNLEVSLRNISKLLNSHVRSITMYGLLLYDDTTEVEAADWENIRQLMRSLIWNRKKLSVNQLKRLCIIMRIPTVDMLLNRAAHQWLTKLSEKANLPKENKIRNHARQTLTAIGKLHSKHRLKIAMKSEIQDWDREFASNWNDLNDESSKKNPTSCRKPTKIEKSTVKSSPYDHCNLNSVQKRAILRWHVHRFPLKSNPTPTQTKKLEKIPILHSLPSQERIEVIRIITEIIEAEKLII